MVTGRFAPSPSGRMHLGNVFTALMAWAAAKAEGGKVVLRIEDLDPQRSRAEYAEVIMDDLKWLGLDWDRRAPNQSLRGEAYEEALRALESKGLLYPCYCSRDQLHAASAPHASDGRVIYNGTCRNLTETQRATMAGRPYSLRVRVPERVIRFTDGLQGPQSMDLSREWGDFIVRRADGVAAYQLAVVVDDGANGVTQVVRGRDLLSSTPAQLMLYDALGLTPPRFYHLPMLMSPSGRRLSKRDRDMAMNEVRSRWTPEKAIGLLAWAGGLIDRWEPLSPTELRDVFSWDRMRRSDITLDTERLLDEK